MGLVNTVVPLEKVEDETVQWCKEIMKHSPTALRFLKAAMNADTDGLAGLQQMAGDATLLYYTTDEAKEGRDAFKEKRDPDFDQFPKFPISYFEYDIKSLASFISDDRWLFYFIRI